jgi:BURP domain
MIDKAISELGTQNIQIMSTMVADNILALKREKIFYKVGSPIKKLAKEKIVLCHPLSTPRACRILLPHHNCLGRKQWDKGECTRNLPL